MDKSVQIFTCTWNMGNADPKIEDVEFLKKAQGYDLVVIGVQEAYIAKRNSVLKHAVREWRSELGAQEENVEVEARISSLNKTTKVLGGASAGFFLGGLFTAPILGVGAPLGAVAGAYLGRKTHKDQEHREHFFHFCQMQLGPNFKTVRRSHLGEMRILVMARCSLMPLIADVTSDDEATGIGHVWGNKGGLAVWLRIGSTSLCFLSCHLAAHEEYNERRASDMKEILRGIRVGNTELDVHLHTSHVIWMGDMNFRIGNVHEDHREAFARVTNCIHDKAWDELLLKDQLKEIMKSGRLLHGFQEGKIEFAPTFKIQNKKKRLSNFSQKYQRSRSSLDNVVEYSNKRIPSYTDRILFHSLPGFRDCLKLENYGSFPQVKSSDHKPVWAGFQLLVPQDRSRESSPAPSSTILDPGKLVQGMLTIDAVTVTLDNRYALESSTQSMPADVQGTGSYGPSERSALNLMGLAWGGGGSAAEGSSSAAGGQFILVLHCHDLVGQNGSISPRRFSEWKSLSSHDIGSDSSITFTKEDMPKFQIPFEERFVSEDQISRMHVQIAVIQYTPPQIPAFFDPKKPEAHDYSPSLFNAVDVIDGIKVVGYSVLPLCEIVARLINQEPGEVTFSEPLSKYSDKIGAVDVKCNCRNLLELRGSR